MTIPPSAPPVLAELLERYTDAVWTNGRIAGKDAVSAWHEDDEADEATPLAALLSYLHDIETRCDPTGEVQQIRSLQEQVACIPALMAERDALLAQARQGREDAERLREGEWVALPFRKGDVVRFNERGFERLGTVRAVTANNYHTDTLSVGYEVYVAGRRRARHLVASDLTLAARAATPSPSPEGAKSL